ncbi:MAG: hypothetical protein ACPGVH_04125 [Chitinophagales bacterium]
MKFIQSSILIALFSLGLFSCEKEKEPIPEVCQTCVHSDQEKSVRIEVCPETLTYYEDEQYSHTLQYNGSVADFVEAHTYGGFTCN